MELIETNGIEKRLEAIGWTQLHTRMLAHRIGDGSVNHYGHFEYGNKHIKDFLDLADFLKIKYWGPTISDKYGTHKVIIPKKTFRDFASIFNISHEDLIRNPVLLLEIIAKLSEEHRFQAILAFIVDDGSCTAWMPIIFEDKNKKVFENVRSLWDTIFPSTSRIYIQKTKSGTEVYHLAIGREGLISLILKIKDSTKKHGKYADLWWKQNNFNERYKKAISKRAVDLHDTINNNQNRNEIILNYLREKESLTFKEIQKILNLSRDRTHLVLSKLTNGNKIFIINAGNRSRYSLKMEDVSFEYRKRLIIDFITKSGKIYNKDCRQLLKLGMEWCYVLLKRMEKDGVIKQVKEKGTTYYVLP